MRNGREIKITHINICFSVNIHYQFNSIQFNQQQQQQPLILYFFLKKSPCLLHIGIKRELSLYRYVIKNDGRKYKILI